MTVTIDEGGSIKLAIVVLMIGICACGTRPEREYRTHIVAVAAHPEPRHIQFFIDHGNWKVMIFAEDASKPCAWDAHVNLDEAYCKNGAWVPIEQAPSSGRIDAAR